MKKLLIFLLPLALVCSCGKVELSENDGKGNPNNPENPNPKPDPEPEPDPEPDKDIFLQYCIENYDTDGDGTVSQYEADQVTSIVCVDMNITKLTDIDKFTNLQGLDCSYNNLTSLDLSKNHRLLNVNCKRNSLTSLILTGCSRLESLDCSYNSLTTLDVSECPNLSSLNCTDNQSLTELWLLNNLQGTDGFNKDSNTGLKYYEYYYTIGERYSQNGKEGIVFYITDDGRHGKIVSTDEAILVEWSTSGLVTGATDENDGMANMKKIQAISGWHEKYPAFAWCADKGDGWYLPAKNELITLYESNAVELREFYYWSSSEVQNEYVWGVNMGNGFAGNDFKNNSRYVRAVCAF